MPLDQPASSMQQAGHDLRMSLGDHLGELRGVLIRALIGFLVALVVCFYFGYDIVALLSRPVLEVLTVLDYPPTAITTDATAGFMSVYVKVSAIAALIIAAPWIVYQLWTFVASGLYEHEKKAVRIVVPFSVVMALLGIAFSYFILLPTSLMFFFGWARFYPEATEIQPGPIVQWLGKAYGVTGPDGVDPINGESAATQPARQFPIYEVDPPTLNDGDAWLSQRLRTFNVVLDGQVERIPLLRNLAITPLPDIAKQINLAAIMTLGCVVAFQLPVVMLILGRTGLIDPAHVRAGRKYAFFGCFALAALLTPADVLSMLILAFPLYGLFELGIVLMKKADPYGSAPPDDD
ncbi:MAG: twin-arginine translocase subunit TatC [Planctomycetota bacterium]